MGGRGEIFTIYSYFVFVFSDILNIFINHIFSGGGDRGVGVE